MCLCVQTLYETFAAEKAKSGKDKLLLTLATASSDFYVQKSYEPDKIYKYVHWAGLKYKRHRVNVSKIDELHEAETGPKC